MRRLLIYLGIGLIGVCLAVVGWWRAELSRYDSNGTDEARVLYATRLVADTYSVAFPGSRYSGMFSSPRLPAPVRLPTGLVEMMFHLSDCDQMARALVYILESLGVEARQYNLFGAFQSHSVVAVKLGGAWKLIDPYIGVTPRLQGEMVEWSVLASNPLAADLELLISPPNEMALAHRINWARDIYGGLKGATGGFEGEEILIPLQINARDLPLEVGALDGQSADVAKAAERLGLGVASHFLGARYGQGKGKRLSVQGLAPGTVVEVNFHYAKASELPPIDVRPANTCRAEPAVLKCTMIAGADGIAVTEMRTNGHSFQIVPVDMLTARLRP